MSGVAPWRTGSPGPKPDVPLPPERLPLLRGGRPRKQWRYLACFTDDLMLCAAVARIGPLPLSWWAVWDRRQRTLAERTSRGRPIVVLEPGRVDFEDGPVRVSLTVAPGTAVETVSPHGSQYAWTRKQGGVHVTGRVEVGERRHEVDGRGIVDESAGYHARHTAWTWSAGVGAVEDGRPVAWNLVTGIHDSPEASERTVWIDGVPREVGPVAFDGLDEVAFAEGGSLRFDREATRASGEDLLVFASRYEQPFGTFTGRLPGGGSLARGLGVMERHEVRW